ncbi:glycolate oxidase subunit GlcE [Pseudomonas kurunegalensis]|uniref:glycolate oxidase subunit GlcE n=1 Tax=Pseudomonas kurunegalensis TaxID=485880 RepID=UPI0023631F3F|nr:glycolate oxidase subunit GlcE [Pseudomonas kurunegalensis]MDD2133405.1 glycolate oxidase subunit GlcE [Pseudomonas kurunegalensis]
MQHDYDNSADLLEQVNYALNEDIPLRIQGSNSKHMLGNHMAGEVLDTRIHRGIVNYDPTELVITARAGTSLWEIEAALDHAGQMLPFEPPHFGPDATVGGMVAAGLSGPRRPWAGAVRDYVLGVQVIIGNGKLMRFGGEVMKNVAGYDLSRLMAGSFGCLGVITEVSLKVLPKPRASASLSLSMTPAQALANLARWGQQPIPITAACHDGALLHLRIEGGEGSVRSALSMLGGEPLENEYWKRLREHESDFFKKPEALWRLSLPANVSPYILSGDQMLDWGGAQRWLKTNEDPQAIRSAVEHVGGHAIRYAAGESSLQPVSKTLMKYQQNLKNQFDPQNIFNPGRLSAEV